VKRRELLRHLEAHGCELLREGAKHSVYVNRGARKTSTVPRHRDVDDFLAHKICRDLDVPRPDA
jgi:predicted RNA binding protein YcfA (HicA-like mRNA interferase family)